MADIIIPGPEGRLEGRYNDGGQGNGPAILFLHPHPKYGGTMNNRVIYELYRAFAAKGCSTLRFNFRGVGRSKGDYSKGEGELADAAAALDWLQKQHQNTRESWVVGFSFGAYIGMQLLMRRPEVVGFIAISPPSNIHNFDFLAPCPTSGLIIHGEEDQFVPEFHVSRLYDRLRLQKGVQLRYETIAGADHFYKGKANEVVTIASDYYDHRLIEDAKIGKTQINHDEDLSAFPDDLGISPDSM